VTSVGGTGTVNGLTLTGTVTTSGNLTLGGTLSGIANSALTNSSITIGGTAIALGASSNALANDITINGVTVGRGNGAATSTAVGYQSLLNDTGGLNTAIGYQAGKTVSNGSITAVGYLAGTALTSGDLTAFGYLAGTACTTPNFNVAVGHTALTTNSTGAFNTALGAQSLRSNTTASNNTAVGYQSLYTTNTGANNVGIGFSAGYLNQSGTQCVFIGQNAGYSSTANNNTFVGERSGYTNTGAQNSFYGQYSGFGATTGTNNTFMGANAGSSMTSGSSNSILGGYTGNQDGLDMRTTSNYVVLSDGDGNRQITMKEGQTLALDSAVPNSGTGITFPATQSASSNANTLDDYEEGTWTPIIVGATTAGTGTYSSQNGRYTKVGNMVTATSYVEWSAHTGTGGMRLGGLPFATLSATANLGGVAVGYNHNIALTALNVLTAYTLANSTECVVDQYPVGGGASTTVPIDTAGGIVFTVSYLTST